MASHTSAQVAEPVLRRARTSRQRAENGRATSARVRKVTRFSAKAREKLILSHLPLVKYVLARVAAHLPAHVDRGDLLEAGAVGLIDAADRFDPARNVRFHTYAVTRIRGAMLDALRSDDWLPRSVRSELTRVARASAEIEQEVHRAPTSAEVCSRTGIAEQDLSELQDAGSRAFYSLDELPLSASADGEPALAQHEERDPALKPLDHASLEEEKSRLAEAILRLTKTERLVITLYYFERLALREIGAILHVTDSRVCQIHRAALKSLAKDLGE
ncbi:MAG: FliA/WhiG family RNA polymerase sigma factor [Candidatus Brocadiia bacterium]